MLFTLADNGSGIDVTPPKSNTNSPPVWPMAFTGAAFLWISQPPVAFSPFAWIALVPWGLLIARESQLGKKGWWTIWAAGALYWLITMQGVRLANPALYPGWLVLSAYLGVYPMFAVGLSRTMCRLWRTPIWIALPIVWTGLELIRSYAFTGFSAAMLGHSQADHPYLTQIADIGGTYYVSFVLAMVSGIVASLIHDVRTRSDQARRLTRSTKAGIAATLVLLALTIGYGSWRLRQADKLADTEPLISVLMLQRNEPLEFTLNPEMESQVFQRYVELSLQAARETPDADLIVWPESMFTGGIPYRIIGDNPQVPEGAVDPSTGRDITVDELKEFLSLQGQVFEQRAAELRRMMVSSTGQGKAPELLVGTSVYEYSDVPHAYGAAVHINEDSKVAAWYGKMHLVMFGEYIPFGTYFPWLYGIGPLRQGATPGKGAVAMQIADVGVAPSICFETMVEHVTGNGLRKLESQGQHVDLIANLTNDAWFHGTAILTHHRRCSQFVAIANRRPLLMTANQGPTTWIDGSGRRIESLPYETHGVLVARPTGDGRSSLYQHFGDRLSWPFAIVCGLLVVSQFRRTKSRGKTGDQAV